jgi:hypothetical protein
LVVDEVTELIREKWIEFKHSRRLDFKDFIKQDTWGPVSGQLEFKGVYVVFEDDNPIYVGSAGKGNHVLKYRIGDLFGYSPGAKTNPFYHTLTRKLVRKRGNVKDLKQALDDVRRFYLENCSFKAVETDTIDQARMLEQVFIILLGHPKYNT